MNKVNKKVIPIKLFGFLWHIGTHMVFPFMTIQMLQIGLNLQDVSIVYGITPLVTFLASPLSGNLLFFWNWVCLIFNRLHIVSFDWSSAY